MSVKTLADTIKSIIQRRIDKEARAMRGTIKDGKFVSGANTYPFINAVDCDTSEGKRVWAQLSRNGNAVIVGT